MELVQILRERNWSAVFGYGLFIAALSAGYYYNLTFVQLGLVDLGSRVMGLPPARIAGHVAVLAASTLVVALATGFRMHRTGSSASFLFKLRLLFTAVAIQTVLTAAAPHIRSERALTTWILLASIALGIGVPSMFGLTCDLVPTRDRGYVAGIVTAAAYFPAAVMTTGWQIDLFAGQLLVLMIGGTVGVGILAFVPLPVTRQLAVQHTLPRFGRGRFVQRDTDQRRLPGMPFRIALLLMFGIYFIDSLGFLRIIETPIYMSSAWHAADRGSLWMIGGVHVIAAVLAGILYPALRQRALFIWVFALFAIAQLNYVLHDLTTPELPPSLGMPLLYAMAVSIYTVLNFTLWADHSTPESIARNTALGVGISGWLASFLSTALSIWWRTGGMAFEEHLRAVAAISLAFFTLTIAFLVFSHGRQRQ